MRVRKSRSVRGGVVCRAVVAGVTGVAGDRKRALTNDTGTRREQRTPCAGLHSVELVGKSLRGAHQSLKDALRKRFRESGRKAFSNGLHYARRAGDEIVND